MRISIIREFVNLAKNLNFTTTSKQCFVTQSTLSKHISSLEEELKVKLFIRSQHGVRLTETGKMFFHDMNRLLDTYDEAMENLERSKHSGGTLLRVGYLHGATYSFLSKLYKSFIEENPDIELELFSLEHIELSKRLEEDAIDIALTEEFNDVNPTWYNRHVIYTDYCCAVMPKNHHLANQTYLTLTDLDGETVFTGSKNQSEYSTILEHAFKTESVDVDIRPVFNSFSEITARIETDNAITISPGHLGQLCTSDNIVFIPLANEFLIHSVSAIWKKSNETPEVMAFVESIERTVPYRDYSACAAILPEEANPLKTYPSDVE